MDISKLDKNFEIKNVNTEKYDFFMPDEKPFVIEGLPFYEENKEFFRLPKSQINKFRSEVVDLSFHTSGVAIRFASDTSKIAVCAKLKSQCRFSHMPNTGVSGFDLYHEKVFTANFKPEYYDETVNGECVILDAKKGDIKEYTLYFPLYSGVETMAIGLEKGCTLQAPRKHVVEKPILFYGSSITQGGCASRPGLCHAANVTRNINAELINLGFSGSAKGEPEMAELIANLELSAFVFDYDFNAPTCEHLEKTHNRFFEIFRNKQPKTPVIMISRPHAGCSPFDEVIRRKEIIINTYERAIAAGDRNVAFIDGTEFFDDATRGDFSVDLCHPNDAGFYFMTKKITPVLAGMLK